MELEKLYAEEIIHTKIDARGRITIPQFLWSRLPAIDRVGTAVTSNSILLSDIYTDDKLKVEKDGSIKIPRKLLSSVKIHYHDNVHLFFEDDYIVIERIDETY